MECVETTAELCVMSGAGVGVIANAQQLESGDFQCKDPLAKLLKIARRDGDPESMDLISAAFRGVCDLGAALELAIMPGITILHQPLATVNWDDDGGRTKNLRFIKPIVFRQELKDTLMEAEWAAAVESAELGFNEMIRRGVNPNVAVQILPLSTAVLYYTFGTYAEWRFYFKQKVLGRIQPGRQMVEQMIPQLAIICPELFEKFIQREDG